VVRPLSLTALLVDDDEAVGIEYKTSLENIDMGLRRHISNEAANSALEDISQLRLPLHALLTDIMRPNGPDGLKFIERLRNANYATTVGGGLRLRYLPVVVISAEARRYKEHVKRIDGMIPVHEKPIWGDRLVEIIVDELATYRAKILNEFQHLGIATVWKDGLYQVLPAYGAKRQKLIDTDRFVGNPAMLAANYTALFLVSGTDRIGAYEVDSKVAASKTRIFLGIAIRGSEIASTAIPFANFTPIRHGCAQDLCGI
jgi:CheY-like chemotaxis protein